MFINQAIGMVSGNLVAGVILAVLVLWFFLRDLRTTLLVGIVIPVCLLVALAVLMLTGRTLNVISIAGLAFGVGMTTDAAVVVLESIVQRREKGAPLLQAALEGTSRVWPALFASTAATIVVFMPVVFMEDAAGQLFADLSLTVVIAVATSLVVAVTLLPLAASRWLKPATAEAPSDARWRRMADTIVGWTDTPRRRYAIIGSLLVVPAALSWLLLPRSAAGEARYDRQVLPVSSGASIGDRQRDRAESRHAGSLLQRGKQPALKIITCSCSRAGARSARSRSIRRRSWLDRVINEEMSTGFRIPRCSRRRAISSAVALAQHRLQLQSSISGALRSRAARSNDPGKAAWRTGAGVQGWARRARLRIAAGG